MSGSTHAVAYSGSIYVRVGLSGLVQTSTDGTTWTNRTSGTSSTLWGVAWGDSKFVVVGDSGEIITSPDGITWTARASGTAEDLHDIAFSDIFVVVGDAGTLLFSEDGIAWGSGESGTTENLWGVDASEGVWIAVGDNETIVSGSILSTNSEVTVTDGVTASETESYGGSTLNTTISETPDILDQSLHDEEPNEIYEFIIENVLNSTAGSDGYGAFIHTGSDGFQVGDRPFINNEVLTDAVTLSEAIIGYYGRTLSETVEVTENAIYLLQAHAEITDAVTGDDSLTVNGIWVTALSDSLTLDDSLSVGQAIQVALAEGVVFAVGLNSGNDTYIGWVMNTAHYGVTKYTNYAFNSFATLNGVALGANDSGIFTLTGADDDGTAIDSVVKTGITDFNIPNLKRVIEAYLGVRNDGTLVLKTITDETTERWYDLRPVKAGIHRTRAKLGRGVKANYWQFELLNKDGDDFELDYIEMTPIVLTRTINGR